MTRREGLTLIELLVVLTILVALAGVGLRSTVGLEEQARFEATQRTLLDAREALVPSTGLRASDGTLMTVSGFLADVGRFPVADATQGVSELWLRGTIPPFDRYVHPSDTEVSLVFGWRGPYVRRPVGSDPAAPLRDGWGHDLIAIDESQSPVMAGSELHGLRSRGADAADGGTGYANDLDEFVTTSSALASMTVEVEVIGAATGSSRVFLRVFAPNPVASVVPSQTPVLALTPVEPAPSTSEDVRAPSTGVNTQTLPPWVLSPGQFAERDLTPGLRVIRAYYAATGSLDMATDPASEVRYVSLQPGNNGPYHLTITIP